MVLNIVGEESLISEQIKTFWDLETLGLFDLTKNSDFFKNEDRKIINPNLNIKTCGT